jgi:Domain of unknown function (DUF4126)
MVTEMLLSHTVPLAFAAGLNVYATIAVIGLSGRFDLVSLPESLRVFENPWVIGIALAMYAIEFVADKVPWFDSVWDAVHTLIRPLGGAFIAMTAIGVDASPAATTIAALVGGSTALATHLTKAGARAAANTSPEPFSNWILSLGEDVVAVSISYVALTHPVLALTIAVTLLLLIVACASLIVRALRRRFATRPR